MRVRRTSDAFAVEYIRMNRRWDRTVDDIFVLMHFQSEGGKIVRMDCFPFGCRRPGCRRRACSGAK
jgi:hypothetical protein